ncbi:YebC/PmpR family DNA-binding transcriptional regulator [bacterium]|nr:YebC/PmpR family DNA-binding transcriptional regulator [bacterium]
MAGHSHWHNIQQAKGKADAKRGILFTKAAQQIILAAREGGGDPNHNLTLRIAVDYARSVNMPKENIERAIKRGTGEDSSTQLEKVIYEGYGPFKIPFIVSAITDNRNRTVNEIRNIFSKAGGELGSIGTVMWQFAESGRIVVRSVKIRTSEKFGEGDTEIPVDRDDAILEFMEISDVEDIDIDEDSKEQLFVKTAVNKLAQVAQKIKEKGYIIVSSGQHFSANNAIEITESQQATIMNFLDTLEEQQDVQNIWHAAV